MLKEKKVYTVITFPNTTAALAMEESCKADGVGGELIPVPNSITAGCGFAWQAAEEEKDEVAELLRRNMESAVDLAVPLYVDIHTGMSLYDAK